ncbi:hypothetical protein L6164_026306 [Bauhinia variegata]|uniref:Uncharacterized protein n=1 Tax=Bauhinia variegata TaxID=167791 RepID=A0ACB9LQ01_BAUVA|nr:hypothetical protein L6164_026306 [Bauhinia variegata]
MSTSWLVMEVFYDSLDSQTKVMVNAATRGTFLNKDYAKAYKLLEEVTTNSCDWSSKRKTKKKVAGIHDIDAIAMLFTKLDKLAPKIDQVLPFQVALFNSGSRSNKGKD